MSHLPARWNAFVVVLALATLVGCQGFSSGKNSQGTTPATLSASLTGLTFNNVTVGQSQTQTETVTNTGGTSATVSQATVAGSGFSISGLSTPLTLASGQSTSFSVTFAPQSADSASGSVMVSPPQ